MAAAQNELSPSWQSSGNKPDGRQVHRLCKTSLVSWHPFWSAPNGVQIAPHSWQHVLGAALNLFVVASRIVLPQTPRQISTLLIVTRFYLDNLSRIDYLGRSQLLPRTCTCSVLSGGLALCAVEWSQSHLSFNKSITQQFSSLISTNFSRVSHTSGI